MSPTIVISVIIDSSECRQSGRPYHHRRSCHHRRRTVRHSPVRENRRLCHGGRLLRARPRSPAVHACGGYRARMYGLEFHRFAPARLFRRTDFRLEEGIRAAVPLGASGWRPSSWPGKPSARVRTCCRSPSSCKAEAGICRSVGWKRSGRRRGITRWASRWTGRAAPQGGRIGLIAGNGRFRSSSPTTRGSSGTRSVRWRMKGKPTLNWRSMSIAFIGSKSGSSAIDRRPQE